MGLVIVGVGVGDDKWWVENWDYGCYFLEKGWRCIGGFFVRVGGGFDWLCYGLVGGFVGVLFVLGGRWWLDFVLLLVVVGVLCGGKVVVVVVWFEWLWVVVGLFELFEVDGSGGVDVGVGWGWGVGGVGGKVGVGGRLVFGCEVGGWGKREVLGSGVCWGWWVGVVWVGENLFGWVN